MGGKSKKQTTGYKYYLGQHLIFCHGPIDKIIKLEVAERVAWEGSTAGGAITVNKPNLFGGKDREGGVSGVIDIEMGRATQGQNDYLAARLGSTVPGYRGVVGAVFRQCYLGNNPYLKPWSARGQRVFVKGDGEAQWYPEKAGIAPTVGGVSGSAPYATYFINLDAVTDGASDAAGIVALGNVVNAAANDTLTLTPNHAGSFIGYSPWGRPNFTSSSASGSYCGFTVVKNGGSTTTTYKNPTRQDGYLAARAAFETTYPSGISLTGAASYHFGIQDTPVADNSGGASFRVDVYAPAGFLDMNPAHLIRECLTDLDWGMGYLEADVDNASFTAAADTLHAEGLGISLLWDRQKTIEDFVKEVVKHIDAALYVSRTTGKFVLKLIRADYDAEELIHLDESNISKVSNPTQTTFGELVNSVTVNYWDATTGKDASLTIQDPAMVQMQGQVIDAPLQYPGFSNARNATLVAQRDLRTLSAPMFSCTIYADDTAKNLNIGDAFKFSWDKWRKSELVMRVTGIAFGDGKSNQIRISCSQDVFSTPTAEVIVDPGTEWVDPVVDPEPIDYRLVFEAPYLELVQLLGQSTTDDTLAAKPEAGYIMAAAARPASAINARMWTDAGGGYEDVATIDFCPTGTLTNAIGKTDTLVEISGGEDLDLVTVGSHVQIGSELCRVDLIDVDTGEMTVGRGVLDTVPEEHSAGSRLFFWDTYNGADSTEYLDAESIHVKIVPSTGIGELELSEAFTDTVVMDQRAYRPYPPGDLKINGVSYGGTPLVGLITVTWKDRDRSQQTSSVLYDHTFGDIGPEAGTTYRLRGYIDDVLVHTEEPAVSGTTWTPLDDGLVRIEVDSKRDGLYSWQAANHEFPYFSTDVRYTEDDEVRETEDADVRITES